MLNQKQINDLTYYFLEEIESMISFSVGFSIDDALNFPPEESILYSNLAQSVTLLFHTKSRNSYGKLVFPGFFRGSVEETKEIISHVLSLDDRAKACAERGYNTPGYNVSHVISKNQSEFTGLLLLVSIRERFKEELSKLYGQLSNLEESEFKTSILDSIKSHAKRSLTNIKHELTDPSQSCSFKIDEKVIHAFHLCKEKTDIKGHPYLGHTKSALEKACFRFISAELDDFLSDINTLYPSNQISLTKSSPPGSNNHFKWNSWAHHYLIRYYCNCAAAKGLDDVDLPDFVKLLAGANHKPQKFQWTGSKAVLSAIFRDLHLGYFYEIEEIDVNPVVTPLKRAMKFEGLFAQLNDDPKSNDRRLEIPIHSQTSSGKDILNQQLFESYKKGIRIQEKYQEKIKPHHVLVLDLLGITYQA